MCRHTLGYTTVIMMMMMLIYDDDDDDDSDVLMSQCNFLRVSRAQ